MHFKDYMLGTLENKVVQSPLKLFQILFRAWVPGNYSSWSTYRLAKTNLFRIINVGNYVVLTLTRAKGGKTPVLGGCSFEEWVFIRSIQGHIGNQYHRNSRRTTRFTVVSPTVCSPTTRVDSPTSYMSVRLHLKTCVTTVDSSTLCVIALGC